MSGLICVHSISTIILWTDAMLHEQVIKWSDINALVICKSTSSTPSLQAFGKLTLCQQIPDSISLFFLSVSQHYDQEHYKVGYIQASQQRAITVPED